MVNKFVLDQRIFSRMRGGEREKKRTQLQTYTTQTFIIVYNFCSLHFLSLTFVYWIKKKKLIKQYCKLF